MAWKEYDKRVKKACGLAKSLEKEGLKRTESITSFMLGRKPKFLGKKTKWEIKRGKRPAKRAARGKLPLAEPLVIAPVEERQAAFKQGKMVFYDGKKRLSIAIHSPSRYLGRQHVLQLVGIYKIPDAPARQKYVGLFYTVIADYQLIHVRLLVEKGGGLEAGEYLGYAAAEYDLGHMELPNEFRHKGLALKSSSRGERHVRSAKHGTHGFLLSADRPGFKEILGKLGYTGFRGGHGLVMEKRGKHQPKDDLNKFYRIEAIDPKNGKARIFTFPIKEKK